MEKPLKIFFQKFLQKDTVFLSKSVLNIGFTPSNILHRDKQVQEIAHILVPALKMEKPSNLFVYGKSGTGKTVTVQKVLTDLVEVAKEQSVPLRFLYVNCKLGRADTEYRLIAYFCRELGLEVPGTGLPTDEVYNMFYKVVEEKKQMLILVLDEIDQLVFKMGDDVLYTLTRVNSFLKNSTISIIGISNHVRLLDEIDSRIKSSLGEENIVFSPYDANQIKDILLDRAKLAFKPSAIENGVIEKCAAIAGREHGDARRAIDLLRISGELADREGVERLTLKHLDAAQEKLEKDRVLDLVSSQPKQHQCVLYSLILLDEKIRDYEKDGLNTGQVYDNYVSLCRNINLRPLTQRRISDILSEFDNLGLIKSFVRSKGRFGRSREIRLAFDNSLVIKTQAILKDSLEA
ncbi:MAG TPA: AAA family ATPase [Candidatus Woesearchaeota archaeon]|nr:AAA family ATPase [Candidatus Woesearchaeota archaeon]